MLDHLSLGTNNYPGASAFYGAILKPLGYVQLEDFGNTIGFGAPGQPAAFWISTDPAVVPPGFHLAFAAPNRQAVDEFHAAALASGARDNGAPGLRPNYGPTYYAAFIITPDGYHLEAVHGR